MHSSQQGVSVDDVKSKEREVFAKWQANKNPQHFQFLYNSMKPLIYDAAMKASSGSNLPESAHRAYAAQNFLEALRTYKPGTGATLQTHIWGAVNQKAKRLNYQFQNLGHMPEPRAQSIGLYQNESEYLRNALGREPSAAEIADRLGWGIRDVVKIQKELHKDLAIGEGTEEVPFFQSSKDEEVLDFMYYDLGNEERVVYDYIFGKNGKPKMVKANNKIDFIGIAKKVGQSESKTRQIFGRIRAKLEKAMKR